jgi:hypothetical protein
MPRRSKSRQTRVRGERAIGIPVSPARRSGGSAYGDAESLLNSLASTMQSIANRLGPPPGGSTSGSMSALFNDIDGLVKSAVDAVSDTVTFADQMISLPSNLGKAYNQPIAQQHFSF